MSSHQKEDLPNPLELNKETLQDLDVEANAGNVKGGALGGDPISGFALSKTLNPTIKTVTPITSLVVSAR